MIIELLADHDDRFASALQALEGFAQYMVKGRYVQETIVREIVDKSQKATALLEEIRNQPEELTRVDRMAWESASVTPWRPSETRTSPAPLKCCPR
ncbi:GvpL/GvpF family gas vesicle protein [Rhodococcus sp. NCIMB 12038]|uniref:GvpL/GvpF family gas vesicle protein n=1 Tax=Rhodococcus sp. NCIMB 12038 TaxID=933800 RepID=UPI00211B0EB3|nr:GvpL/GvpF family gas vesicle protein [Rhodococcus sp. NCIMB 12038]